jgi:hypothetical protein
MDLCVWKATGRGHDFIAKKAASARVSAEYSRRAGVKAAASAGEFMRVRSLMVGATLLAAVCGGGIAHAGSKAPGTVDNLDALFAPVQFNELGGANSLDALARGLDLQSGYSFDSSGQFNVTDLQSSSAYDGLLLSSASLNLPYAALTSDSSYVGANISIADGLRVRFGAETLAAQNPEFPTIDNLALFGGPQQYDQRSARTGLAGVDWDFASWGGLGIVASRTLEQNGVLGSANAGPLALSKSASSTALGTSAHVGFGDGWVTTVSFSQGITNLDLRANSLESSSETLHSSAYALAIAKHNLFGGDSIAFSVIRPIEVYSGDLGFLPTESLDTGANMIFGHTHDSLLGPDTGNRSGSGLCDELLQRRARAAGERRLPDESRGPERHEFLLRDLAREDQFLDFSPATFEKSRACSVRLFDSGVLGTRETVAIGAGASLQPAPSICSERQVMAVQYVLRDERSVQDLSGRPAGLEGYLAELLPGAKIGIVGVNGAGKSTLLRIMSGMDKEFTGEAWAADGVQVGYLQQEPQLDPSTDVLGNVMAAWPPRRRCSTATTKSPPTTPTKPPTRCRRCRTRSKRRACGISIRRSRWRWIRCAVPSPMPKWRNCRAARSAAWRCAGCCSKRPTFCCSTSRPTISTRNRSPGSNTPARIQGHDRARHP